MTSKRNFGDQSSEEKLQEKLNIKMNKIYWEKIHQVRNQLEEKYLGYEICPKSHRDFNYNRQRFSINYEDSGVLWKDYWQKRLKEWYENDYKTQKLKIWEEVRKNFDEKQKHDESLLSENQTVSSNNTEEQTHASETDIPDVTKNEDVNLRCGEQEITSTQLHDETVEITENNQKKTCIDDLSLKYANQPETSNASSSSSTLNDQMVRKVEENLGKIWEQGNERGCEEIRRDMQYLKSWMDALSSYEIDCLIELVEKENPMQSEILDTYFDLQQQTRQEQSEDDENCL